MKIEGEWMVKDLEVITLASRTRTALRMETVDKPQGAGPRR